MKESTMDLVSSGIFTVLGGSSLAGGIKLARGKKSSTSDRIIGRVCIIGGSTQLALGVHELVKGIKAKKNESKMLSEKTEEEDKAAKIVKVQTKTDEKGEE